MIIHRCAGGKEKRCHIWVRLGANGRILNMALNFYRMDFNKIATLAQKAAINEGTKQCLINENREECEFEFKFSNEISKPFFITSEAAKIQILAALQTEIKYRKAQIEEMFEEEETYASR